MRSFILWFLFFLFSTSIVSAQQENLNKSLNSSYTFTIGDYAALIFPELLKVQKDIKDQVIATYEPDPNVIDLEIYGSWDTVERGRDAIAKLWTFVKTSHIPYIERRFEVKLKEKDFRIFYYNRFSRKGQALIVQMVDGKYTLP